MVVARLTHQFALLSSCAPHAMNALDTLDTFPMVLDVICEAHFYAEAPSCACFCRHRYMHAHWDPSC
jgi:hypothetical protein